MATAKQKAAFAKLMASKKKKTKPAAKAKTKKVKPKSTKKIKPAEKVTPFMSQLMGMDIQPNPKGKKKVKKTAHKGFNKASADIAQKEGISPEEADAILASASRKASPSAKAKNPNLNKVKGKKKG